MHAIGGRSRVAAATRKGSEMNQLSEILDEKGTEVLRIDADASVFEAVTRMGDVVKFKSKQQSFEIQ
jgi:hypothetical protein